MTDVPTVILNTHIITYLRQANRVQVARNRFLEVYSPRVVCLFDETIAPTIVVGAREDTVFVVDNRRHTLTRRVEIGDTLRLHYRPRLFGHIGQKEWKYLIDFQCLFVRQRSPCVPLNAAASTAGVEVAAELLFEDIKAD